MADDFVVLDRGGEPEPIVPGEFMVDDAGADGRPMPDNLGVPLPEPTPDRPITAFNPTGAIPPRGRSFADTVAGAWRSGTLLGATREAIDLGAVRWENSPERAALVQRSLSSEGREALVAKRALAWKDKAAGVRRDAGANDALYEQVAYDLSDAYVTPATVAGTVVGSMGSPEVLMGFGGLLARTFPATLGQSIVARTAADAAISNTLTDPVVQGVRLGSGAQEEYNVAQTVAAPVVGAVAGAGLGAAAKGAGQAIAGARNAADALSGRAAALTPEESAASSVDAMRAFDPANAQRVEAPPVAPELPRTRAPETLPEIMPENNVGQAAPAAETRAPVVDPAGAKPQFVEPSDSLARDASWVIRNKETGEVVMETFDPKAVAALNTQKYEAIGIREYLGSINGKAKPPAPPAAEIPAPNFRSVAGEGSGAFQARPDVGEGSVIARLSADKVRADLGQEIPGTLIRQLRGMPEEPGGITGYHGSPHDFDRFSMEKIGTGEGAQAYGHGLYFAEREGVARHYQQLGDATVEGRPYNINDPFHKAVSLFEEFGSREKALEEARAREARDNGDFYGTVRRHLESDRELPPLVSSGSLYEVRINAKPETFLDWDKPLTGATADAAFSALTSRGIDKTLARYIADNTPGSEIYSTLTRGAYDKRLAPSDAGGASATAALREAGISGIRYLDGGSRGNVNTNDIRGSLAMWETALRKSPADEYAQQQVALYRQQLADAEKGLTSNYVVFDDNAIRIVAKNGKRLDRPENLRGEATGAFVDPMRADATLADRKAAEDIKTAPAGSLPAFNSGAVSAPATPGAPAGIFMFDAPSLKVDAQRFQFKDNGDAEGVTPRLKGVTRWDQAKGNQIIVWQDRAGDLYVVDGHQRSGLARRLIAEGKEEKIELPGLLYREVDGISAEAVRSIAAAKNLGEGSGSALDGAKVLRTRPDLLDGSLPLTEGKTRQAANLAKLGDEPFRMVVNEVVPEHYGAVVGEVIPTDPVRQEAAIKAIARFEPRNVEEATALAQRVAQAELEKAEAGKQASMFDDAMSAESTAGEEMRIVARVIQDAKRDKSLLGRVVDNAARIEQTGSTIARDAAQAMAGDSALAAKVMASEAYSRGPVRDALLEAARNVKSGKQSLADAARDVFAAVRAKSETDVRARAGDRGSDAGSAVEPGADGKPQLLVPGVSAVTDGDRLRVAAGKPLTGGDKPPPAGGLFDENARNQDELFLNRNQLARVPFQAEKGRPKVDSGNAAPEAAARVQRIEDIGRSLVEAFETVARTGKVGPGKQGVYKIKPGVVRTRGVSEIDVIAHEVGHKFHMADAKGKADKIVTDNEAELKAFGASDGFEGRAEAFAELFHAYVMNRAYADRQFPNAAADLDNLLRSEFPKQYEALAKIREALDALHRAPSVEAVSADLISKPPPRFGDTFKEALARDIDPQGRSVFSVMDALYTANVDSKHPVYRAMTSLIDTAKANGRSIDLMPVDDPYILSRRISGAHSKADTMLKHGVIPAGGVRPEGASLASGIETALGKKWDAGQFQEFGAYLTARRMVAEYQRFFDGELERPPGKFSVADYQNTVAALEAKYPGFAAGADQVYAFQRAHLKRLFDKGMVTREFYDTAQARADYVPLMRDMADFAGELAAKEGPPAGRDLAYSVAKRFKGSDRSVINPLESIFKRVHDLEYAIQMNDTIAALAKLSDQAGPGSGYILEHIPSNQLRAQKVDVIEALRAAGKAEGLDNADLTQMILQVEDRLGDSSWATLFRQEPITPGKEPIVFYWQNGERRAARLGDGKLGAALYHSLTAMSDMEKNWLISVLQISQMMLRTGVTKSPDFMLVNLIRDQFTSMLTGGRGYIPFVSAARGLVNAVKEAPVAIEAAGQGILAGGAVVHSIENSRFGKDVTSLVKGNLLSQIGKAFELSEAGTRIGLYESYLKQAKAQGWDDENAALWAGFRADDYIDFRKHGSQFGALRRAIPFLNAAVQGNDKELRSVGILPVLEAKRLRGETLSATETEQLKDARVALVRLATMGIVLGAGLAYLNQDNDRWTNAPKFFRDTNFMFSVGGHDFSIPKGFGVVQTVTNLFERAAEYAARRDPQIALDWLDGAVGAFSPPTTNPLLGLFADLPANYDRFRGRPIVPYYMQGWDTPEQYGSFTSSLSRQIARAADNIGLNISPMKIDYAMQQLGGGMARDVMFGWDALMGRDRPEKQIYDYPVLRRFVKNFDRGSQATRQFYDLVGDKTGKYELAENAYRGKINNGERAGAADYLRNLKEDDRAWVVLNTHGFDTSSKRLHPMYNARERVSVINGIVRQLATNNLVKEDDLDRRDLTRTRRDATPITLDAKQRAQLIEHMLELSVATARNAMVAVGAKGTAGLRAMDTAPALARMKAVSPEAAAEFEARIGKKNLPSADESAQAWPEMRRRLLVDGENADLSGLVPASVTARVRRRAAR